MFPRDSFGKNLESTSFCKAIAKYTANKLRPRFPHTVTPTGLKCTVTCNQGLLILQGVKVFSFDVPLIQCGQWKLLPTPHQSQFHSLTSFPESRAGNNSLVRRFMNPGVGTIESSILEHKTKNDKQPKKKDEIFLQRCFGSVRERKVLDMIQRSA